MGKFRSPKSQARHMISQKLAIGQPRHGKAVDGLVHSLGTARTYRDSLACLVEYVNENRLNWNGRGTAGITREIAIHYLEHRSAAIGQKQLDKDRQAMEIVLGEELPIIRSNREEVLGARAYTPPQIELIAASQTPRHGLATLVAADAGLRAIELHTIAPIQVRGPSPYRPWSDERFMGRSDVRLYTVLGKGGLIREVAISNKLAKQLELLRLAEPRTVVDREIYYKKYYEIGGGHQWSDSFTKASLRTLGWTSGGHGVRHTYAQARMLSLQVAGVLYEDGLETVSQEMGHFRPEITEVYLR